MIDPNAITQYDRTDDELLELWLFSIFVAGKRSDLSAPLLDRILDDMPGTTTRQKFEGLAQPGTLRATLERYHTGQYKRIERALLDTADRLHSNRAFLRTATAEDLCEIHGVAEKSARLFIVHSRRDAWYAVLDTHVLAWLRSLAVPNVPKASPTGAQYRRLEKIVLEICRVTQCPPARLDLDVWKERRLIRKEKTKLPGAETNQRQSIHPGDRLKRQVRAIRKQLAATQPSEKKTSRQLKFPLS